jgi:hypothetical protein
MLQSIFCVLVLLLLAKELRAEPTTLPTGQRKKCSQDTKENNNRVTTNPGESGKRKGRTMKRIHWQTLRGLFKRTPITFETSDILGRRAEICRSFAAAFPHGATQEEITLRWGQSKCPDCRRWASWLSAAAVKGDFYTVARKIVEAANETTSGGMDGNNKEGTNSMSTRPKIEMENPPANDLAGLRNQVRMIWRAMEDGRGIEARLGFIALIDDLSGASVIFSWMTAAERAESDRQTSEGICAYMAEQADGG